MKHKTAIGSLFLFFGNAIGFSQVQSDSLFHNSRKFGNLKEKYTDNDFNYIEKTKIDTSAWDRFWSAVGQFLRDLFCISHMVLLLFINEFCFGLLNRFFIKFSISFPYFY